MQRYTITLPGARTVDGRLTGRAMGDLLRAVADGATGALRLRIEGRSATRADRPPAWLEQGADFTVVDFTRDEPGVVVAAPSLEDSVPSRFEQKDLFSPIDPRQSVLSLLTDSLSQAAAGRADSDAFDADLLGVFARDLERLFKRSHAEGLSVTNGSPKSPAVELRADGLRTLSELRDRTPSPRRVRVAGSMDVIRYSTSSFLVRMPDGSRIRGVLTDSDPEMLRSLFGEMVLAEGTAQFRPSGSLLRIDVDRILPASDRDVATFGAEPAPLRVAEERTRTRKTQGPKSGINAVIGAWPGDETDEEVDRYLRDVS
jgi:hypothetical protein